MLKLPASIQRNPTRLVLLGYASYVLVTWLLLCLPICWQMESISPLDNLFMATSAISTTGLVTVNTPDAYNYLGEFVIMAAFQVGGLGYMTLGSFVLLSSQRRLSRFRRNISTTVFALPEGFSLKAFLRHTVIFTALAELAGAICLYIGFSQTGADRPLWSAIFHSISAFCTAGFSVFPNSLEDFRSNLWINVVVSILSLFGAIGFIVISDFWQSSRRRNRSTTLTTRIILITTAAFILVGWLLLLIGDGSLASLPFGERLMAAWFQSMTALTTVGFNTHPIGELTTAIVLVMLVLMIVGASPSGTGGGLKSTSVTAALATMWSAIRGREMVTFWGRRIPQNRILSAFAALMFYVMTFVIGSGLLLALQDQPFEDVLFEAASALGTVGLSRGITGDLQPLAKVVVIAMMFIGRLGPLTFGLALFADEAQDESVVTPVEEDIAI